jgi:hypothetical protein
MKAVLEHQVPEVWYFKQFSQKAHAQPEYIYFGS